jgi:hypothetical protein
MICFVFDFILHAACTVDACAVISILPSLSLIDMTYFTADTKATPLSVQAVGVDFQIGMDFASPQRGETFKRVCNRTTLFRCVFGSADGYGI